MQFSNVCRYESIDALPHWQTPECFLVSFVFHLTAIIKNAFIRRDDEYFWDWKAQFQFYSHDGIIFLKAYGKFQSAIIILLSYTLQSYLEYWRTKHETIILV